MHQQHSGEINLLLTKFDYCNTYLRHMTCKKTSIKEDCNYLRHIFGTAFASTDKFTDVTMIAIVYRYYNVAKWFIEIANLTDFSRSLVTLLHSNNDDANLTAAIWLHNYSLTNKTIKLLDITSDMMKNIVTHGPLTIILWYIDRGLQVNKEYSELIKYRIAAEKVVGDILLTKLP